MRYMIYLVIYLVRPPGETTPPQRSLAYQDAHPVVSDPR